MYWHIRRQCANNSEKAFAPEKGLRSVGSSLLTEEQNTQRLKCAREILKTYKGCNSRVISKLLTGDETWVHMFEPQRRADNEQWKRKDQKRPCIAKRTISSKKMLYACFFFLIQVGQSFKYFVHLIIQSLADSKRILY